ncbi:hypothetical protein MN205_04250 [Kineococcus sp. TRM81007]|uniref:hypothetical protein n=1 Tax=Kineococcus sp. TRM81007 TaxID=2925831 RepID=UPI001F5A0220|nr:hypothetical protein [Kineococcus sp. TRM81007]MCI2237700.1 hypothetical protein [Kineococcus sp. TRM81007]
MLDASSTPLPPVRAPWRGWAGVRAALLAVTLVVLLVTLVFGERAADVQDLRVAARAGRVAGVQVVGGLPAGATGEVVQRVRWRADWRGAWQVRSAEVRLVSDEHLVGALSDAVGEASALPVTTRDVGQAVRAWDPGVRVERVEHARGFVLSARVLGATVRGWVVVLLVVQSLGALLVLIGAAEPWWATRWAWFWLFSLPLGTTAFLLLSGPLPGRRQHAPGSRRLRGGWAFVLAVLVGGSGAL